MKRSVCLLTLLLYLSPVQAAKEYYAVLASFSTEIGAQQVARDVSLPGLVPGVLAANVDGKTRFRVLVGPFADREAAARVRAIAVDKGYPSAWLLTLNAPPAMPAVRAEPATADARNTDVASPGSSRQSDESGRNALTRRGIPADLNRGVRPALRDEAVQELLRDRRRSDEKVLEPVGSARTNSIAQRDAVFVSTIVVDSPFLEAEIAALTVPYTGRLVSLGELFELRDRINQLCVVEGYINSGVVIPDQQVEKGVLRLEMVVGELSEINVSSRLRTNYVTRRIRVGTPFNLGELQASLKLLEKNQLVSRVHARVEPGSRAGLASLNLDVETTRYNRLGITAANSRAPSVGSEYGELYLNAGNLLGFGDSLFLSGSVTRGLDAYAVEYRLPFNARDHALVLAYSRTDATAIEAPFDTIDIDSVTESARFGFILPVRRTPNSELALELFAEARRNFTTLFGVPFSFSEGAINGESRVAPVRLGLTYVRQGISQSLAGRLVVSRGTTRYDATRQPIGADAEFTSGMMQLQYSRQLSENFHVTAKALVQYAADPLLAIERVAIGGFETVRGYRENQLVRDNVVLASVEGRYQLPVAPRVELVSFVDWAGGENHKTSTASGADELASVGVGLDVRAYRGFSVTLFFAHGFSDVLIRGNDLQDDGIHFRLNYEYRF